MSELFLLNLWQFFLIPLPQRFCSRMAFALGFNTTGWAAVGVLCLFQSYGVLSRYQGIWAFFLCSNPWQGRLSGCVAFGLCFNSTAHAITGGWDGWYSLQYPSALGRPQGSCAFFLRSNNAAGEIPCTCGVWILLQYHGAGNYLGLGALSIRFIPTVSLDILSGVVSFFLRPNPKAGEITDLLHYSPNLNFFSN